MNSASILERARWTIWVLAILVIACDDPVISLGRAYPQTEAPTGDTDTDTNTSTVSRSDTDKRWEDDNKKKPPPQKPKEWDPDFHENDESEVHK